MEMKLASIAGPIVCLLLACGAPPRPADPVARLSAALDVTITSDGQDAEHWALARRVVDDQSLVGHRRAEIAARLGPGTSCAGGWSCGDGLDGDDWYYEVGKLPAGMDGGTPVLLIDFDGAGNCVATRTVHTQ
jgi:hypothetical protein